MTPHHSCGCMWRRGARSRPSAWYWSFVSTFPAGAGGQEGAAIGREEAVGGMVHPSGGAEARPASQFTLRSYVAEWTTAAMTPMRTMRAVMSMAEGGGAVKP